LKKKPYRRCVFCDGYFSDLSTHIGRKHHDLAEVKKALHAGVSDRIRTFAEFRRRGILKSNEEQSKNKEPKYERERNQGSSQNLMCTGCKTFITKRGMPRPTLSCQQVGFAMKPVIKRSILDMFRRIQNFHLEWKKR